MRRRRGRIVRRQGLRLGRLGRVEVGQGVDAQRLAGDLDLPVLQVVGAQRRVGVGGRRLDGVELRLGVDLRAQAVEDGQHDARLGPVGVARVGHRVEPDVGDAAEAVPQRGRSHQRQEQVGPRLEAPAAQRRAEAVAVVGSWFFLAGSRMPSRPKVLLITKRHRVRPAGPHAPLKHVVYRHDRLVEVPAEIAQPHAQRRGEGAECLAQRLEQSAIEPILNGVEPAVHRLPRVGGICAANARAEREDCEGGQKNLVARAPRTHGFTVRLPNLVTEPGAIDDPGPASRAPRPNT